METSRYPVWFFGVVLFAIAALMAFNWAAGVYIFNHPQGKSVETLSGFERSIKPVWLEQIRPQLVLVGSSRVRDGFDPTLIDRALHLKSFNYGASSITPYETRRFVQDALAQPNTKDILVSLDAFSSNSGAGETLPGFDETRLAVTPSGAPTSRRALWQFTTRYLSGGAMGMNALSVWSLLQLKPNQSAADRPDLFDAYSHMTQAVIDRDLDYRRARGMRMGARAADELKTMLAATCNATARLTLFFPPDNMAIIAVYQRTDASGLKEFKHQVSEAVATHNATCPNRAALFDFLAPNQLTTETLKDGQAADYVDLVHFRPPAGLWLLRQMGF